MNIETFSGETIVAGEVIVRFEPGTSEETRDQVLAEVDGTYLHSVALPEELVVAKVPVGSEVSSAASLEVDTNVVYAEPRVITRPAPVATIAP